MKRYAVALAALILAQACPVYPAFLVVPNALETVEGEAITGIPFTRNYGEPSARYQQVYAASQFAGFLAEGAFIDEISFRPDGAVGWGFNFQFLDFSISLSTTQKNPGQLSTNFSENVGPDELVVRRGAIQTVCDGPWQRPAEFTLDLPFTFQRFFYRPAMGNLLVDMKINTFEQATEMGPLDGSLTSFDAVSFCYATNVNSSSGRTFSRGLVTQFSLYSPPQLTLSQTASNLVFEWYFYPQEYILEMTTNLNPHGNSAWKQVGTPSRTNFNVRITLPFATNAPAAFYRLRYAP